jgi:hypothetical protein
VARFIGDRGGGSGANKAAAQRMTTPSTLTSRNPENHLDSAQVTKRSVNFDFEGSQEGLRGGGGETAEGHKHAGRILVILLQLSGAQCNQASECGRGASSCGGGFAVRTPAIRGSHSGRRCPFARLHPVTFVNFCFYLAELFPASPSIPILKIILIIIIIINTLSTISLLYQYFYSRSARGSDPVLTLPMLSKVCTC